MKFLVFLFLVVGVAVAIPYKSAPPQPVHKPAPPPPPPVHKPAPPPKDEHYGHHHHRRDVEEKSAAITDQHFKSDPEGNFEYNYETQNGIVAHAIGTPKALGGNPPEIAETIQGTFSWKTPDGKSVNVQYTADENGYYPKVQI